MEAIEHRGNWWLADQENSQTAGILEYDPVGGGTLELFDSIKPEDGNPFKSEKVSYIFGQDETGTPITLHNCDIRASQISSGGINHTAYPNEIFVGARLPELRFDKIRIQYPNLIEWIDDSSITTSIENTEETLLPSTSVESPDDINVEIEDYTVEIKPTVRFGWGEQASIKYDENGIIELSGDQEVQFQEARELIKHLQHYFALSIDRSIYPEKVKGVIRRDETRKINGEEVELPHIRCDIYYVTPKYSKKAQQADIIQPHFTSSDVSEPESISRWISHSREVETFHELFFNTMYDSEIEIKYQFLSLCMAIESYFGHHYPDKQHMSDEEWEALRSAIFEVIPDDAEAADRLRGLIGNIGNEYSLKDKLEVITEKYSEIISECFDRESAIKDITNTRNDIAHGFGGDLPGSKTDSNKLIPLLFKTRIIVEVCLYNVIGLSSEKILNIIKMKYDTSNLT